MVRIRPVRYVQVLVSAAVVLTFLVIFSSDDDIVIPQGGKVMKNLRSFMMVEDTEGKKWDPFGLGLASDDNMKENIYFKADLNRGGHTPPVRECDPVINFAFVKTHKAGSTTLISILQRFGYTHDLKFALPTRGDVFLGWPYKLDPKKHILPLENGEMEFNVLVNHAIFNKTTMSKVVPDDPQFIGIVRSPLTHFKSVMNYFQKMLIPEQEKGKYTMMERIIRFADNPVYYDGFNDKMKNSPDPAFHVRSVTKNFQSADFGLVRNHMEDPTKVKAFFDDLHQTFPFLLVMEYMHESLLLLKRKWCWEIADILFLQKNVFKYQNKNDAIPEETATKLLDWMSVDVQLYSWANKTLWTEIAKEKDFSEELAYYKTLNNLVGAYCKADITLFRVQGDKQKIKIPPLEVAASQWSQPLTVSLEDCKDLMRFEMAFTRMLQIQQRPDLFDDEYYFKGADGIHKFVRKDEEKLKDVKQEKKTPVPTVDVRAKILASKKFRFAPVPPKKSNGEYIHADADDSSDR